MPSDKTLAIRRKRGMLALKASKMLINRFFARAKQQEHCLVIGKNPKKYARVEIASDVFMSAHRFALIVYSRKQTPDMFACHTCPRKNCIAKAHLYWGTPKQNCLDMDIQGTRRVPYSISGYKRPINRETARQIAIEIAKQEKSFVEIAEDFDVTRTVVQNIESGRAWRKDTTDIITERRKEKGYFFGPYGQYHQHSKIDERTAKKIISFAAKGMTVIGIARKLGISQGITKDVRSGATWSHLIRPPSIKKGKSRPPVFVSKKLARQVYTLYHWHGQTVTKINLQTKVPRNIISSICQKRRQAEHTEGLKSRQHVGHKNRAENRNLPGVKLCGICNEPFDYKAMGLKARKKTCSATCLGESRRRTVSRTHAEGRMPYTK